MIWCDLAPCLIPTRAPAAEIELEQKGLRAASVPWFDPQGASANDTEILFVALLVIVARESVSELDKWASEVLEHEAAFAECSETGLPAEWRISQKLPVPAIYQRIHTAYQARGGSNATLDKIGKAINLFPRPGGKVGPLGHVQLKHHFTAKNKAVQKRWKSPAALFAIARLVKRHGVELRQLLGDEAQEEECLPRRASKLRARGRVLGTNRAAAAHTANRADRRWRVHGERPRCQVAARHLFWR